MELYRVRLQYRDRIAERDSDEPLRYKVTEYHAAVPPGWGGEPVLHAANAAVESVVGPPDAWDDWQPVILSVTHLGTVRIDPRFEVVVSGANSGGWESAGRSGHAIE